MQPDSATRVLLALILVALVIRIVQGFTGPPAGDDVGRFSVTGMRAGTPLLVRLDSVTGEVWKVPLGGGVATWQRLEEPEPEPEPETGAAAD